MNCYCSTGCFRGMGLRDIVRLACKYNLPLELSSALPFVSNMLEPVFQSRSEINLLVHNYFPPPEVPFTLNLASLNQDTYARSIKHCMAAIDLCAALGSPFYSVHAGFALEMEPDMLGEPVIQAKLAANSRVEKRTAYEAFIQAVRQLASYAVENKVGLLIENNVVAPENVSSNGEYPMLLADVYEIQGFFNEFGHLGIGLLLDVGHAKVTANSLDQRPEAYFDELKAFIRCLHLSDNDGVRDTNSAFNRQAWFMPHLKELLSVPIVLEVNCHSLEELLGLRCLIIEMSGDCPY